jgi:hypothetical protein
MNGAKIGFGLVLVVAVIVGIVLLGGVTTLSEQISGKATSLHVDISAPSEALYADEIAVKVTASVSGTNPAINPKIRLVVTLGEKTIFDQERPVQLVTQVTETFTVRLVEHGAVLQVFADKATINAEVLAENAGPDTEVLTIDVRKPSAAISVELPNDNVLPFLGIQLKSGTRIFKDISAQYTGSDPGPFQVVAAVVIDSQYNQFFTMNEKLTQKYEEQGKIIWLVGKSNVDPSHPVWKVPLDASVFTVTTGGADSVNIKVKVVLLLVVGQDQYLPIAETQDYAITILK